MGSAGLCSVLFFVGKNMIAVEIIRIRWYNECVDYYR